MISVLQIWHICSMCCCCCSIAKSCPISCNAMTCSMPGFPTFIMSPSLLSILGIESVIPFNHLILCHPILLLASVFPRIRSFPVSLLFASGGQSIGASASPSVLPMNIQGWFPLSLIGLISLLSKGLSRVFSSNTFWKHQFFSTQLCDPTLTSTWLLEKP